MGSSYPKSTVMLQDEWLIKSNEKDAVIVFVCDFCHNLLKLKWYFNVHLK